MQNIVLSVSDLVALVNQTLEYAYPSIIVEGEIASFKVSKNKYVFFDLKDDSSVLGCFMMVYQLRMPLEDGMKIQAKVQPRLTTWGKFSLNVMEIKPVGEGSIKKSFELLKKKLEKEGLFAKERKRLLPEMPDRIGLIASVESAGYKDFLKILESRWGGVEVQVADVQVQGIDAGNQIVKAVNYFNSKADPVEVIVIVRGGGSAEDLAVFNEEPLVRSVAVSRIPTLVGVGHETDTSLVDLVADIRAATPSNAAQLLVPDRGSVKDRIEQGQMRILHRLEHRIQSLKMLNDMAAGHLLSRISNVLNAEIKHVEHAESLLKQLNPRVVLKRGYALVRDSEGKILDNKIKEGDDISIEMNNVIIDAGVKNVKRK